MDPIKLGKGGYMLPAGDRHIVSIGLTTKLTEKWKMGITYARVMLHDEHLDARPASGVYDTDFINGYSHVVSFDLSTTF
jgi:long-subunit fatty acid transport protein